MRTIKFRALLENKEGSKKWWVYYPTMEIPPKKFSDKIITKDSQFTGLSDKNGVEIYEGDILRVGKEVKWEKPNSCTCCDQCSGWNVDIGVDKYDEIIGNIYENKELIK